MSRLVRSHRLFSEKDRVRFKHVPVGTWFIWRGRKWIKTEQTGIAPHKRVMVTRASGIAKFAGAAETKERE